MAEHGSLDFHYFYILFTAKLYIKLLWGYIMFSCRYCNKGLKSKNALVQHEIRCKQNPERIIPYSATKEFQELAHSRRKGKPSWNHGLTKDTDERIANAAAKFKERYRAGIIKKSLGKGSSPEIEAARKEKISKYAKSVGFGGRVEGSGRGKKGWYKGFFCDSTYELVYVIYNLDHDVKFERCKLTYDYMFEGNQYKYYPDFILEDGTIVEIKGYHTKQVDAKLKAVTDRPVIILYEKDLKYAFDWVKNHYTYKSLKDLYEKTK